MSDTRRPVNTPHIESYSWKLQSTSAHSWRVVVQFPGVECSEVRGSHLSCTLGRRVGFEGDEGIDVAMTDDVEVILTLVDKVHWQNSIEWRDHTEGEFFQDLSALSMIFLSGSTWRSRPFLQLIVEYFSPFLMMFSLINKQSFAIIDQEHLSASSTAGVRSDS